MVGEVAATLSRSVKQREHKGWKPTLRLLERLGSLDVLHSVGDGAGNGRGYPFLRIVWLDGAQGGLSGGKGAVGTH
jgi:hypothetical protein